MDLPAPGIRESFVRHFLEQSMSEPATPVLTNVDELSQEIPGHAFRREVPGFSQADSHQLVVEDGSHDRGVTEGDPFPRTESIDFRSDDGLHRIGQHTRCGPW